MSTRVKQRDVTDCGAACIASVASYYKLFLPVARIRQLASTDQRGTNIRGLTVALNALGFETRAVKGDLAGLFEIPKPAIAHTRNEKGNHHYVVVYGASASCVEVMDPADGKIHRYKQEDFAKSWTGVVILILPGKAFQKGDHTSSAFSRFWDLVRPVKRKMIQALVGALMFTLLGLSISVYVQKIVDHVLVSGNKNLLNLLGVVMIVLLVIQTFIGITRNILTLSTGQIIDAQLILGYYRHLIRLPQSFFDTMRMGEIISRIGDAVKIRAFINDVAVNLAVNVFVVIFSFALMFTYYWKLAVVILLILPVYAIIYYVTNKLNRKVERSLMENAADLESQLVESISAVSAIKSFGIEHFADSKTEDRFLTMLKSLHLSGSNSIYSTGTSEFFARLFTIILLWSGAGFVLQNEITPGELLSFYTLIAYFTGPASSLIGMNKTIQSAVIASERLFEIMELHQEKNDNKIRLTRNAIGDIVFSNISFSYSASAIIFTEFSARIPRGRVTALVGESGCGKSTLVSILQNLYPIAGGNVFIGEHNLKYIENNSLRKVVSTVPQHVQLFSGTILENIALGEQEPDLHKVIEICSSLHLLEYIEKLPQGFDTMTGENGALLSGGQRQRIAIARALYRDPEILILDEATSSLDSESEMYVQDVIELMRIKGKTVIIVAHRLSTVAGADKIIVLEDGKLVEEGKHDALIAKRGTYHRLWRRQHAVVEALT